MTDHSNVIFFVSLSVTVRSWHVPDETWQSVEISHLLTFGSGYLTWEWHPDTAIRSHLYPIFFAPSQLLGHLLGGVGGMGRYLVILLPRVAQAVLSAAGDACASAFCLRHFGARTHHYFLPMYATSWFLNYCSSRPLVNSFEVALTSVALWAYPTTATQRRSAKSGAYAAVVTFCFVIRPTAALFWAIPVLHHFYSLFREEKTWHFFILPVSCALATMAAVVTIDSYFYGTPTLVPWNFFIHNVVRDVASFYGVHTWHWYLTCGLPVVLGGYGFPALLGGLWTQLARQDVDRATTPWVFAISMVTVVATFSLLPHKEFRFLLPVLPLCWCFAADFLKSSVVLRRWISLTALAASAALAFVPVTLYLSLVHQTGGVATVEWLAASAPRDASVLFLMPCHSTPFRSHLHGREDLRLRFLTCEPPLSNDQEDEAEHFYRDPDAWLRSEFGPRTPPSHLVMYDTLAPKVARFLEEGAFALCADFFHTHFPEGRASSRVTVYCREGGGHAEEGPSE